MQGESAVSTTTIATCAFPGTYNVAKSVELHLTYIEEAAAAGAQLVVFPETGLQGYPPDFRLFGSEEVQRSVQQSAERVPDGTNVQRLIAAAMQQRIHVIFGLTEEGEQPGVLYNTLVLAGPDGFIGSYRKVHVGITEKIFWRPGNEWPVFDTPIGKIGMLICYDKMWPEACRELTLAGAELLVMGTAWCSMPGHGEGEDNLWARQYKLYDRVRAAENARWFISSNFVGELGGLDFFGLSQIVDPLGDVVATSGTDHVGLVMADIDIAGGLANAALVNQGSFLIRDRRPETYRIQNGSRPISVNG
jgi:predicted amidohydrolase